MTPPSPPEAEAAAVARLQRVIERLRRRMAFIEGSKFWQLRSTYFGARRFAGQTVDDAPPPLPPSDLAEALDCSDPYARWLLLNEPRPADLHRLRRFAEHLPKKPRITVLAMAGSTIEPQAYPFVNIVHAPAELEDPDAALIAVAGPGETLSAQACAMAALTLNERPEAQIIYGDHDRINAGGRRTAPFFAPQWSPDTLLAYPYVGVAFFDAALVELAGGIDFSLGPAIAYDLALRATEHTTAIEHCAALFSHRLTPRTSAEIAAEDVAVHHALERRKLHARIERNADAPEARTIRYSLEGTPSLEVIVPTRDHASDLLKALDGVFRSSYPELRVTIVDNGSVEPQTHELFDRLQAMHGRRLRILRRDEPFNFSRLVNAAAAGTDAEQLLLLNNDTEAVSPDWIEALLEYAQQPGAGAVGARLLYADGSLQHAGVAIGIGGFAGHPYRNAGPLHDPLATSIVRDCMAVTAACLMVRRETYQRVGGFDERLAVEFNDIDFCLKLREGGLRNIYLPHVTLYHHESQSRGVPSTAAALRRVAAERETFRERWGSDAFDDPFYHPALTRLAEDASLAL